jgi:alpha-D-ribose 1-methylphosphonate 5-triphosphate synthase subunit PhnG
LEVPVHRPSRLLAAALLGGLLSVGGCASAVAGVPQADPAPQPTEGRGADPVAWVDKVCGAVLTFTTPVLAQPNFDGADLAGIKQRLSDYLAAAETGLQQSRDQLGQVGSSPVGGGDATIQRATEGLEKLQTDISTAKAKVDAANPADVPAFQAALGDTQNSLSQVTAPDVLGDLRTSPRLAKAVDAAPACGQLQAANQPR